MEWTIEEDIRRALGIAIQVLEEQDECLQPASNMRDMKAILDGKNTGRDSLIITQGVAAALVIRTRQAMAIPLNDARGVDNRLHELTSLFALARLCDPWTFAIEYNDMCNRLARTLGRPASRLNSSLM